MNLERVLVEPRRARQLVDRAIDLVGDDEVEADDEVRRLARLAPIDPLAVAQLVPLPGLADGQAGQQRHQTDEQRSVKAHARLGASRPLGEQLFPASLRLQHQLDQLADGAVRRRAGR